MSIFKNKFQKIATLLLIIFTVFNLFNCIFYKAGFLFLVENQILYIYSSLAQIIGALLGLIIAGYSIIDNKNKSMGEEDNTITDYTNELRQEYLLP